LKKNEINTNDVEISWNKILLDDIKTKNFGNPDKIKKILKEDILPNIKEMEGVIRIDEIEKFYFKMKNLGETYKLPGLISYTDRLMIFGRNFDLKNIEKHLSSFPKLSEWIENIAE